jgi:hypothetical protein
VNDEATFIDEPIFIKDRERFVLPMGDYVVIAWNTKHEETTTICGECGTRHTSYDNWTKYGEPYIDFAWIDEFAGEYYEDEHSPVNGGIEIDEARQIVEELTMAIEYLEKHKQEIE